MDFLTDFSKLFIEKHGPEVHNKICNNIKKEAPSKYNDEYVQIIFKIALLNYWGISDNRILDFLKNTNNINNINITDLKQIHKISIKEIQKYVKIASNNEK